MRGRLSWNFALFLVVLAFLLACAWSCGASPTPSESAAQTVTADSTVVEPLVITQILQFVNQYGTISTWYGPETNVRFPQQGTYIVTTWDITTGTILFKAKLITERVEILETDRDVHSPE